MDEASNVADFMSEKASVVFPSAALQLILITLHL